MFGPNTGKKFSFILQLIHHIFGTVYKSIKNMIECTGIHMYKSLCNIIKTSSNWFMLPKRHKWFQILISYQKRDNVACSTLWLVNVITQANLHTPTFFYYTLITFTVTDVSRTSLKSCPAARTPWTFSLARFGLVASIVTSCAWSQSRYRILPMFMFPAKTPRRAKG
jgi:hypothetical protein